jgi:hypothetical protein
MLQPETADAMVADAILSYLDRTSALEATREEQTVDKSQCSNFTKGGRDARYTDFSEQDSTAGRGDHAVSLR